MSDDDIRILYERQTKELERAQRQYASLASDHTVALAKIARLTREVEVLRKAYDE